MVYYDVVGIGYAVCDELLFVPDSFIKKLGVKKGGVTVVSSRKLHTTLAHAKSSPILSAGGSAANTAKALVPFGSRVAFASLVGTDRMSKKFQAGMQEAGVDTYLIVRRGKLGRIASFITPDAERTFFIAPGISRMLQNNPIFEKLIKASRVVHIEGYTLRVPHLTQELMALAKKHHKIVSFDLGNFELVEKERKQIARLIQRYVDIVFMNENELYALFRKKPREGIRKLQKMCAAGVILRGKKGSIAFTSNKTVTCGAPACAPRDTTGAGDFFIAGFLMGAIADLSLYEAAILGTLSAARAICHVGTDIPCHTLRQE